MSTWLNYLVCEGLLNLLYWEVGLHELTFQYVISILWTTHSQCICRSNLYKELFILLIVLFCNENTVQQTEVWIWMLNVDSELPIVL